MASTLRSPSTPLGPRSALTSPRSVQSPLSGTVTSPTTTTTTTSFDQHRLEADLLERPYLPDCWSDERRMAVLFSPFRVRDTNPEGWDLKMNFWTNAISRWCLQTRTVAFTLEDVRRAFLRRDGHQLPHPDCLVLVLSTMKRRGALMTDQELPVARNARSLGRSLLSWSVNSLLLKPLSVGWSLLTSSNAARADSADSGQYSSSSMSSTASSSTPTSPQEEQPLASITAETKLFSRETLDLLVESVEGHLKGLTSTSSSPIKPGSCLRYHHFTAQLNKTLFAGRPLDEASFAVVIEVAEAKTGARLKTMTLDDGIRIVKISGGGEGAAGSEAAINQTDISLIKLEATRELLEAEVDRLSEEADALREEARQALAGRSREKALLLLKRKKRLEGKITAKDTAIDNIEAIYQQVLDTHSATAITRALAYANAVLKQRSGVVLSDLEDTMTAIEDTMGDVAALSSEINRPLASGDTGVELDAEEELDQMLKELESEKKEAVILDRLDQLKIADEELSSGEKEEGVAQTPTKQLADLQA